MFFHQVLMSHLGRSSRGRRRVIVLVPWYTPLWRHARAGTPVFCEVALGLSHSVIHRLRCDRLRHAAAGGHLHANTADRVAGGARRLAIAHNRRPRVSVLMLWGTRRVGSVLRHLNMSIATAHRGLGAYLLTQWHCRFANGSRARIKRTQMARRARDCAVYRLLLRQGSKCCARGCSRYLLYRVSGWLLLSSWLLLP